MEAVFLLVLDIVEGPCKSIDGKHVVMSLLLWQGR